MTPHPDDQARATDDLCAIAAAYVAIFGATPIEAARHVTELLATPTAHDIDACPICSAPHTGDPVTTTTPATWHGIDSRRVLPAADLALVTRFGEALMEADRLNLELAATLHQIRWFHVDAITVDTSADDTEPPTGHRDPAGNAGIGPDRSAADLRRMRRLIETAIGAIEQAATLADGYPTQVHQLPDVEPTPGEDWCLACWKDGKYHSPVALHPDGRRRFKGLCRWCGEFKAANGFEPPTWLLHEKHRGQAVTQGMVDNARAEDRRERAAKAKSKGKRKGSTPRTKANA